MHALCLGVIGLQATLWGLGHRSTEELVESARTARGRERVDALFLLLERADVAPVHYGRAFAEELLRDEDPLVRDFAHTTSVCKHTTPSAQLGRLERLRDAEQVDEDFWRAFVLLRRKLGLVVGGSSARLKLRELNWWLDVREGRPLPADEVLQHVWENP
jgi:hypothetical protein